MKAFLKNFHKTKYFHVILCALLLIAAALILFPYKAADRHSGHDLKYHFSVIRSLMTAWDEGVFGGKIMELIGGDYGYGTGIFYSTLPASVCVVLIKLFHLPFTGALYVEMLLLFAGAAVAVYFFLLRVFRDGRIAAIGSILYLLYPYFWWDLYVRFAFTEIFLMLALPLIVWGVYELLYKSNLAAFLSLFISGYTLAIFCHFTMTVYITLFIGIWLLIEWKRTFQRKIFPFFLLATAIVLLITASYYIPMLVNYGITDTASMSKTAEQIKANTLKYYTEEILTLDFLFIAFAYGLYVLYYIFAAHKKRTAGKTALLLLSTLILLLYCPYFPWKYVPNFLRMIQYTFRVLLLAGITTPLTVGIMIRDIFFRKKEPAAEAANVEGSQTETLPSSPEPVCKPKKHIAKIADILAKVLLSLGLLCCGWFCYRHNSAMPSSLYNNASSTTFGNDAIDELTGNSEFYGLGAGKHGDYFPQNCNRNYVSTRLRNRFIDSTNMNVSELAVYEGLSQVSFLAQKTNTAYAVLNVPYECFDGVEVCRYQTNSENGQLTITAKSEADGKKVRLETGGYGGESKIILSYKNAPAFKEYLQKTALGVLTLEGEAVAKDLQKQHAGKYSLSVTTDECGGVLELPSFYYRGYTVTFVGTDGSRYALDAKHGRNGFIEVAVQESGTLYVEFTSFYLTFSYVLTGLGIAAFAGTIVWVRIPKRKPKDGFPISVTESKTTEE